MLKFARRGQYFGTQLNFHSPKLIPYSHEPNSPIATPDSKLPLPLYVNVYKSDSSKIAHQLHKRKIHTIQQGGLEYMYTESKVGLAIGVKDNDNIYESGAKLCREARGKGFGNLIFSSIELKDEQFGQFISGLLQANYQFKTPGKDAVQKEKSENEQERFAQIQYIHLLEAQYGNSFVQQQIKSAYYKNYARELINQRQNGDVQFFIREVKELFSSSEQVKIQIIEGEELKEKGLNLIHAVGRGSMQVPALINLTYNGNKDENVLHSFVGKGIIFDTGGHHIKPYGSMEKMFMDKSGACIVLSAFRAAVELGLKINLTVTLGLAENAIGNNAYKPSEILVSHKGLTVEVNNTDAEGRLVLADCISWTEQTHKPSKMIEISTLTGACAAALGESTAGIFTNNDNLSNELCTISNEVQEQLWRLPVTKEHFELMKGDHTDLCNMGKGKVMGAQKAAAFILSFLDKTSVQRTYFLFFLFAYSKYHLLILTQRVQWNLRLTRVLTQQGQRRLELNY